MKSIAFPCFVPFSVLAVCLFCCAGCDQPEVAQVESLPKLDFHKPADFQTAVSRIREVHDLFVSDAPLPAATSFTVAEIVHSHGDGDSHVHYRRVDDSGNYEHDDHDHEDHDQEHEDHDDDAHEHEHDDHGDGDPSEAEPKMHTTEVDVFTELTDIVRWLPSIASDGDMPESSWLQVKTVSEELSQRLAAVTEPDEMDAKRTAYQLDSKELETHISKLESMVETSPEVSTSNE